MTIITARLFMMMARQDDSMAATAIRISTPHDTSPCSSFPAVSLDNPVDYALDIQHNAYSPRSARPKGRPAAALSTSKGWSHILRRGQKSTCGAVTEYARGTMYIIASPISAPHQAQALRHIDAARIQKSVWTLIARIVRYY